jgi:hypothetical protein
LVSANRRGGLPVLPLAPTGPCDAFAIEFSGSRSYFHLQCVNNFANSRFTFFSFHFESVSSPKYFARKMLSFLVMLEHWRCCEKWNLWYSY